MTKRITILDVAKLSGYGVGTVSRALSGDKNVKKETKDKILKVVEELNFTPNINGGRLRRKHSGVIAVLVPIINHPFFGEFVEELDTIAMENGYSVILVASKMHVDKEKEILKKIRQREVDGAVFVTHYKHSDEELKDCPLVSVDRHLNNTVPFVSSDNYESTKNAIEYLISTGAKKIGYLGTKPSVDSEVSLREKAYRDVLAKYNMPVRIINKVVEHGEEETLVDEMLETYKDLDAIFASGATISRIAYYKLVEKGIRLPEDMQLISYDGVFDVWNKKTLITSIKQPVKKLAEEAFNILIKVIHGEEVNQINIYPTEFIKTNTTK